MMNEDTDLRNEKSKKSWINLDVQIKEIIVQIKQENASCMAKDLSGILKEKINIDENMTN